MSDELNGEIAAIDEVVAELQPAEVEVEPAKRKRGAANLGRAAYARVKAELAKALDWKRSQPITSGERIRATKEEGRDHRRIAEAESRRLMKRRHDDEVRKRRLEEEIAERLAKRERGRVARKADYDERDRVGLFHFRRLRELRHRQSEGRSS